MGNSARLEIPQLGPGTGAIPLTAGPPLPELIVFEHENFNLNSAGEEIGDSWRTTFNFRYVGDDWSNEISSLIILSGIWEFYDRPDYGCSACPPVRLGPGHYPQLDRVGIPNDRIQSFQVVAL